MQKNSFPAAWKVAQVPPIPKNDSPSDANHYRPISVLPALSMIYEWLVPAQMLEYIQQHGVLQDKIYGHWKDHSTGTILLRIKDDIIKAMKKRGITLIAFSKAFDTVDYCTVLERLHAIEFSPGALKWI